MNNFDLLTTNKFVEKGVYNLSTDQKKEDYLRKKMEFRMFMEQKKSKFTMGGTSQFNDNMDIDDLANSNAIDFKVNPNPASEVKKTKSKTFNRPTSVAIDSRDRDTKLFPDANSYKIKMNKAFVNVSRVGLKSTEFPNTQQLVRATPAAIANNILAWQNQIDTVSMNGSTPEPSSGYITYKTSIEAGNYDASSLQKEIQTKMNAVTRVVYTTNDGSTTTALKNHTFTVVVDPITDKTEITSVEFNNFSNVLHTKDGESRLYFAQKLDDSGDTLVAHGFTTGDRIFIKDANDIGGIDDSEIAGEHVITLDKVDEILGYAFDGTTTAQPDFIWYIKTSTKASLSVTYAGGTSVKIGTGISFRLKWDLSNTLASVLGFKDSIFPAKLYDKLYLIDGITPDTSQYFSASTSNIISITSFVNSQNLEVTRESHGLANGDIIAIDNWPTEYSVGGIFPSAIDSLLTNNTYEILKLSDDKFSFKCGTTSNKAETKEFNGQLAKEGDEYIPLTIYELDTTESFALIVNNTEIKSRLNIYKIEAVSTTAVHVFFTSDHGMSDGDRIYMYFDGKYGYLSSDPRTDDQIKASAEISNPSGYVVQEIDTSTISIPLSEFPEWTSVWDNVFGSGEEPESDKTYGTAIVKQLSKGINLDGENYLYFCINEFPAMTVSSSVDSGIFYKLILNGAPGSTLFNTFVGNAFVPQEGLMAKLEYLTISFRTQENNLFQFNNAEHSFTLEVIEVVDLPESSGMSSRRGK
jgi:hypothetical protein